MKHLKTFEFFSYGAPQMGEEEEEMSSEVEMEMYPGEEEEITIPPYGEEEGVETCPSCDCEECECTGSNSMEMSPNRYIKKWGEEEEEEEMMPSDMEVMKFEAKKSSKKAKPDFLDLDKDGDKKESMKKAAADKKKGESKSNTKDSKKGSKLSKAQEKLPPGLKKAIAQGVRD